MLGDEKAQLEKKYQQLMEESFRLSHANRKQSDLKRAEAEEVGVRLDALEREQRS